MKPTTKIGVFWWEHIIVKKEGSIGDSAAEKGGLNSPTCETPQKWGYPPPADWLIHACNLVLCIFKTFFKQNDTLKKCYLYKEVGL